LAALCELDKLSKADATQLSDAYQQLRRIENAIQMLGNQQTHLLPSSTDNQERLLVLLGLDSWRALLELLHPIREFVHQNFEELFAEQGEAQSSSIVWPSDLSDQADDIVEAWENGFINYGVSNQVRHRLRPLTRGRAAYLADDESNASDTIIRLHEFFRALPSGEQYFRLLAESPVLLNSIVQPLLHSPAMTVLLKQSPHIIDCYVHSQWKYPDDFDDDYVRQADDYGEQLERMRRFVNEYLYQLYLSFMQGDLSVDVFQTALTDLAEHTLDLALDLVTQNMGLDENPITVVGLGKVAMRKMSPLSDLDLIFIFDHEKTSLEVASRFVSRLQTAIATPMREGIVYELDTRLRPSGRSGAPTVSIDSFAGHHNDRAHTWEHIALAPGCIVAGNRDLEARFNTIKADLISRPRDQRQFLKDAQKMWHRIAEHRVKEVSDQVMYSKLRQGGLMQAEYLAACLILSNGHSLPIRSIEFDALLAACDANGKLAEAIEFWRVQQLWERLLGHSEQEIASIPAVYRTRLFEQSKVSTLEELLTKTREHSAYVQSEMEKLFAAEPLNSAEIEQWLETKVTWQ